MVSASRCSRPLWSRMERIERHSKRSMALCARVERLVVDDGEDRLLLHALHRILMQEGSTTWG